MDKTNLDKVTVVSKALSGFAQAVVLHSADSMSDLVVTTQLRAERPRFPFFALTAREPYGSIAREKQLSALPKILSGADDIFRCN